MSRVELSQVEHALHKDFNCFCYNEIGISIALFDMIESTIYRVVKYIPANLINYNLFIKKITY